MRVLYSHRIKSRDGQAVHLEGVVSALRRSGHQVLVIGPASFSSVCFGGENRLVALVRVSCPKMLQELAEIVYNLIAYIRLEFGFTRFRPDFIYERCNTFYIAGALLASRRKVPFYAEVNFPLADETARISGLKMVRAARAMERIVWRKANRILVVTAVLRDILIEQGAPPERIAVMPNGTEVERFLGVPEPPRTDDAVIIGFIGFMREWHGLAALLTALARHKDERIKLLIAGDGPNRLTLQKQAHELGLSAQIGFAGLIQPEQVPFLLAGIDIAVQPRAVRYASPLKIFEYMAAGRAIVAPNQPNIREILSDGATALLFDPEQENAMWLAILRLVEDTPLRHRLGKAGQAEIVRLNRTWQANAERVTDWARADLRARASCQRPH